MEALPTVAAEAYPAINSFSQHQKYVQFVQEINCHQIAYALAAVAPTRV
jgi:hypothetical protein